MNSNLERFVVKKSKEKMHCINYPAFLIKINTFIPERRTNPLTARWGNDSNDFFNAYNTVLQFHIAT